jgi:virginiamycin B lyase
MRRMVPFLLRSALVAVLSGVSAVVGAVVAAEPNAGQASSATIRLDGSVVPQGVTAGEGPEALVWFAAAKRSAVGEIDPANRTVGYISLGHGARPRAIARCPNKRLYVADPSLNVIHEIAPETEVVTRHPMPVTQPLDLSGIACTAANLVVFTGYNGFVGKLDPASGAVTVVDAAGGRGASPVTLNNAGLAWFASYVSGQIIRLDPVSLKQDTIALPAGVEGPKGVAVDTAGRVWITAFRSGRVARYDPRRRSWDAWALGDGAKPFAIVADQRGGVVVTDVGRNIVVRFDPTSGSFTELAALTDRGQARNMVRLDDKVWISESAADRVIEVPLAAVTQ